MANRKEGREGNREVGYLRDEVSRRFIEFCRQHKDVASKSRFIEKAVEFYLDQVEQYGLDFKLKPKVPPDEGKARAPSRKHA